MNPIESFLSSVKRCLEASTPGPWTTDMDKDGCLIDSKGFEIAVTNDRDYFSSSFRDQQCRANANFIANSRTDLEKAVKALRIALDVIDNHGSSHPYSERGLKEIARILGDEK